MYALLRQTNRTGNTCVYWRPIIEFYERTRVHSTKQKGDFATKQ